MKFRITALRVSRTTVAYVGEFPTIPTDDEAREMIGCFSLPDPIVIDPRLTLELEDPRPHGQEIYLQCVEPVDFEAYLRGES